MDGQLVHRAPADDVGPAGAVTTLIRLMAAQPQHREELERRVAHGLPVVARGVSFTPDTIREALALAPPVVAVAVPPSVPPQSAGVHTRIRASGMPASSSSPLPAGSSGRAPSLGVEVVEPHVAKAAAELDSAGVVVAEGSNDGAPGVRWVGVSAGHNASLRWNPCRCLWQLHHHVTGELVFLADSGEEWCYEVLDGDAGIVFECKEDAPEHHLVDDLFDFHLFSKEGADGERLVVRGDGRGPPYRGLCALKAAHQCCTVSLNLGLGAARDDFDIAVFVVPRRGQYVHWRLESVIKSLNFQRSSDTAGSFIQKYIGAWDRAFEAAGLPTCLRSLPYQTGAQVVDDGGERVLRWISCPSASLVLLLSRWSGNSTRRGALRSQSERDACAALLSKLLQTCFPTGAKFALFLVFDHDRYSADLGLAAGSAKVTLEALPGARVDLATMYALAVPGPRSPEALLRRDVRNQFGENTLVSLMDLLAWAGAGGESSRAYSLFRQLVLVIGHRIDHQVRSNASDGDEAAEPRVKLQGQDDDLATEHFLALYLQGVEESMPTPVLHLSASVDKSRVHSIGCFNGAYALPNNLLWWGVPQDVQDFVGSVTFASLQGEQAATGEALEAMRARQRAFLKRKVDGTDGLAASASWRPKKRKRRMAYQWLCALHNQLQRFVPDGALYFQMDEKARAARPASLWPRLTVAPDMGSDGVSALSFYLHELEACVDCCWDQSHGVWNDCVNAIKASGLHGHLLLSLIRLNVPVGPWHEDIRWKECCQSLDELLTLGDPTADPLFQYFATEMFDEPFGRDLKFTTEPEMFLWRRISEQNPFVRKGTKCNLGRFMDVLRRAESELEHWSCRAWIYLHTCLEMDMMGSAKFKQLAIGRAALPATTTARKESTEEVALRRACQNQMVLGTMFMLDPDSKSIEKTIVLCTAPWAKWHGLQNAELRSCSAALPWLQRQLSSELREYMVQVHDLLSSEKALKDIGFVMPDRTLLAEGTLARESDLGSTMVRLCFALTHCRLKRLGWMILGWSSRSALFLSDDAAVARREMLRMQDDQATYESASAAALTCPGLDDIVLRSPMKHVAVQQVYGVMKENNFQVTAAAREWLVKAHSRLLGSQLIEDGFNVQKNAVPYQNRRGTIQRAFHTLVTEKPASTKHHFQEVAPSNRPVARDMQIPKEAYKVRFPDMPRCFLPVTSLAQKTSWPSPKAEDWSVPFAEMRLLSVARRRQQFRSVQFAWLSGFMQTSHNIAVREKHGGRQVYLPLGHIGSSVAVLWPARFVDLPGRGSQKLIHMSSDPGDLIDLFHAVLNIEDWEATRVSWMTPAMQSVAFGNSGNVMKALQPWGIKGVVDSKFEPLIVVAAKCAFWALNRQFMLQVCKYRKVKVDDDSPSLFAILLAIVKHELKVDDESAVEILQQRLVEVEGKQNSAIEEFLDTDDALLCVQQGDLEDLRDAVTRNFAKHAPAEQFKSEYSAAARRVRVAREAAVVNQRKRRSTRGAPNEPHNPSVELPTGDLIQTDLKPFLPPGASVWRGNRAGTWSSHMPPFSRCVRSWHLYGHREAAILCLRDAWAKHLTSRGLGVDACTVRGLFDEQAARTVLPSGAASSASGA